MGGAVYFCWPQAGGGQAWQLLGTINNNKPSAIFRLVATVNYGESSGVMSHHLQDIEAEKCG